MSNIAGALYRVTKIANEMKSVSVQIAMSSSGSGRKEVTARP